MTMSNRVHRGATARLSGRARLLDLSDRRWIASSTAMAEPLIAERLDLSAFGAAIGEGRFRLSVAWRARAARVADLRWLLTFRDRENRPVARSVLTKAIGETWTDGYVLEPVSAAATVAVDLTVVSIRSWWSASCVAPAQTEVATVHFRTLTVDADLTQ